MAYCEVADVRLYAPQIPADTDLDGHIAEADGIIDANLRSLFTVPLTVLDQIVVTISARLTAGNYLIAYYSAHNREPSEYAQRLIDGAMKQLTDIAASPERLSAEVALAEEIIDDDRSAIDVGGEYEPSVFGPGDERTWGE